MVKTGRSSAGHAARADLRRGRDCRRRRGGGIEMQEKIIGTVMPVLELMLDQSEEIVAEAGELSWISSSIDLHTSTQLGGAKGFFGVLKRAVGGGGLFM